MTNELPLLCVQRNTFVIADEGRQITNRINEGIPLLCQENSVNWYELPVSNRHASQYTVKMMGDYQVAALFDRSRKIRVSPLFRLGATESLRELTVADINHDEKMDLTLELYSGMKIPFINTGNSDIEIDTLSKKIMGVGQKNTNALDVDWNDDNNNWDEIALHFNFLLENGETVVAETDFKTLMTSFQENPRPYLAYALALFSHGDYARTISLCTTAANSLDEKVLGSIYELLGLAQFASSNNEGASESLWKAYNLRQASIRSLMVLAILNIESGRIEIARTLVDEGLRIDFKNPLLNEIKADILIRLGKPCEAKPYASSGDNLGLAAWAAIKCSLENFIGK